MPQANNLVIMNGAAVNKTFTLFAPAPGDTGNATWKLKEGADSRYFPTLTVGTKVSPTARKLTLRLRVPRDPLTGDNGGPAASCFAALDVTVPDQFPESMKNDWVAYVSNVLNHSDIKAALRDAVPLT